MRPRSLLVLGTTLALSIVSTTFVLLALTSKRWSAQKYYYPSGDGFDWKSPLCTAHRSPFYRCDPPALNYSANIDKASCNLTCNFYKPYGRNATSCRLLNETGDYPAWGSTVTAGAQECQDVHYSGNLQIAASVFITLGLLLCLVVLAGTLLGPTRTSEDPVQAPDDQSSKTPTAVATGSHHHHQQNAHRGRRSTVLSYMVTALMGSLYIGAVLQFVAQFFAVLGLTLTATPTPNQVSNNHDNLFGAKPWIMDIALTRYATVAWTTAIACAMIVGANYRTPRFERL
ncbi:hypothetical protein H2200_008182 [Cladophialophora chaetospira]|uniref:Uncharacterized protein n=1 Tax=Cladophialophora chaetospira TaxID=386627 RepID=A0AA38X5A7_9EURO|nr:hypothetical protein H2200_008182 [Cladophialophora chaetospira]